MRSFPSTARQRLFAATAALTSIVAGLAVPLAQADDNDLRNRQREVEGRIANAASDLQETSREVAQTSTRLLRAQGRLADARADLSDVRSRLADARARDARLQADLVQAELDLEKATAAMASAAVDVEDQRDLVRQTALSIYTGGDPRLRALGTLLESGSIEEVGDRQLGNQVVSNRQSTVFGDLSEVEDTLTVEQAEVERTTEAVEAKRVEAAAQLEEVKTLFTESVLAEQRVEGLVVEARAAREQAFVARAADRRILHALKAREAKIEQRLVELARSQRAQVGFRGTSDGYLSLPTDGPVTSPYGFRTHPIYGYYSLHDGNDYGTGCGTPLYAPAGGTVIDVDADPVYGNRLFLSLGKVNGESLVVIYNHSASYRVSEGDKVERGAIVGYAGDSGWSTGCHLHFTVMENGVAVDPAIYL